MLQVGFVLFFFCLVLPVMGQDQMDPMELIKYLKNSGKTLENDQIESLLKVTQQKKDEALKNISISDEIAKELKLSLQKIKQNLAIVSTDNQPVDSVASLMQQSFTPFLYDRYLNLYISFDLWVSGKEEKLAEENKWQFKKVETWNLATFAANSRDSKGVIITDKMELGEICYAYHPKNSKWTFIDRLDVQDQKKIFSLNNVQSEAMVFNRNGELLGLYFRENNDCLGLDYVSLQAMMEPLMKAPSSKQWYGLWGYTENEQFFILGSKGFQLEGVVYFPKDQLVENKDLIEIDFYHQNGNQVKHSLKKMPYLDEKEFKTFFEKNSNNPELILWLDPLSQVQAKYILTWLKGSKIKGLKIYPYRLNDEQLLLWLKASSLLMICQTEDEVYSVLEFFAQTRLVKDTDVKDAFEKYKGVKPNNWAHQMGEDGIVQKVLDLFRLGFLQLKIRQLPQLSLKGGVPESLGQDVESTIYNLLQKNSL